AAAERLVGQYFGRERALVRPARRRAQRGDGVHVRRSRGRRLEVFARTFQRSLAPGSGHGVDVEVGQAGVRHALRTEFGQARVDAAGDAAEVGIAGVAEAEHGELQLGQLGRAPALQEFDETDRVVRRVALALG